MATTTIKRSKTRELTFKVKTMEEQLTIYKGLLRFANKAFNDYFEGGDDKRLIQARNAIKQVDL